jgi:LysM repeat protein
MKYILILFLFISNLAQSQQEKTFTHKVAKNESIAEISEKYNVTPEDIFRTNPEAKNGIQENNVLVIPNTQSMSFNLKKSNIPVNTNITLKNHTIQPKETLYSISKVYNISVQDIEKANVHGLENGLKIGQTLIIPLSETPVKTPEVVKSVPEMIPGRTYHLVKPQETLFGIARLHNVSVKDLDESNSELLKEGLRIGQNILIPNKKKTIDGRARVINEETIFHTVAAKETKYSISKKYGVSIAQLESQNPEIINGLIEGNQLAINVNKIAPKTDNDELMIALAEKQVAIEKNKAKTLEIEDLQDKLTVQKQMNQKVLKVNALKVSLNEIDETKGGSAQKLKLVLEANKNVQEILISKLDSLVITMGQELEVLKKTDILDLEKSKILEKESYKNIGETNELLTQLKRDLTDNRKIYAGLMNKVQRINHEENYEYKKKVKENVKNNVLNTNDMASLEDIKLIQTTQEKNDKINDQLLTKIDSIGAERKLELKRRIGKATFYSSEAREYDDKMALAKLKRYQKNVKESQKDQPIANKKPKMTDEEIRKKLRAETVTEKSPVKIEVIKNIKDVENGYYLVNDVFTEADPRDVFTKKLSDAGELAASFFYNVNNFSYYVYSDSFKNADQAIYEYKQNEKKALFEKMFIVQIVNE